MNLFENAPDRSPATAIENISPSNHVCSICRSPGEWLEQAALVLKLGLERGEKCVYVGDERAHGEMIDRLLEHRIDVLQMTETGALAFVTPGAAGLKGDHTDPYRMFTFWKKAGAQAAREGYRVLRGATQAQWLRPEVVTSEQLRAYEERLDQLAEETGCIFLCHYDADRLPPSLVLQSMSAHSLVIHRCELCRNIYSFRDEQSAGSSDELALEMLLRGLHRQEQSARELHGTQAELERVARILILGELTASIAHEVAQPVAGILADAGAALRWLAITPPQLDEARLSLTRIVAAARRAESVIQRIRSLVKKADSRKELLGINDVIAEVIALTRDQLRQAGISLRMELAMPLPPVWAHRVQIQQVILNLIVNAIEAIDVRPGGRREIRIRSEHAAQYTKVSVIDSGIGLGTDQVQYVLKPFYTTKSHGMGIGLSISSRIIEGHNGQLWAERNPDGVGAAFHFTLPLTHQRPIL
jgi:signal transduction histidine kinase